MMTTFFRWLLISSADPEKVSLSVKAFLYGLIPLASIFLGLSHVQVGDLTPIVDSLVVLVQASLGLVASAVFAYGAFRKVVLTIAGRHAGLTQ